MIGRLICWWRGHDFPPIPTWRWSRGAKKTKHTGQLKAGRGAAAPLGARARRRAVKASLVCSRCGGRKGRVM